MEYGRLKYPYIAVMKEGSLSYGGNQQWSSKKTIQKYGCGVIAGTDLLLYLSLHKDYCKGKEFKDSEGINGILDAEEYMELAEKMKRHYFPVIPGLGMPVWLLAGGINRYFHINRIPLKVSFGVWGRNLRNRVAAMLAHDIPVILAVGPNFPVPVKKQKLSFYEKKGNSYEEMCSVAAHFVVVTTMEGEWLQISSWGKTYYINLSEYQTYVRRYSFFLVSNIFYIRKRK